jgi:WS/DGAT/MGAT family acyltransferase
MAYSHHERLSALDDSFLELEDASSHMHIGAVAIFEAGPLRTVDGGIDVDRIRASVEAGMHRIPRYRQRLERVPLLQHPVWVDDARFNLDYHLRHTHLPQPGDVRQLKRLAARIMSQQLDRGKPLWELWIVEGVQPDHFALITKVHHCMIDGVGSVELTGSVMQATADAPPRAAAPRWVPRPAPSPAALLASELGHRAWAPIAALGAVRRAVSDPRAAAAAAREVASGVAEAIVPALRPASPTPFNVHIGPHRRFDWATTPMDTIRGIRQLGGTLNDVVLAVLAGALRRFLHRRGLDPGTLDFRVMMPVNVRSADTRHALGNQVTMLLARLPLDEAAPRARLDRVIVETGRAKRSHQGLGVQTIEELSDWTSPTLLVQFGRLTAASRPFNMIVTNVPGPPCASYMLGARMTSCFPLVPLYQNQALGVALFSYDGRLHWGFNADWDALPDLHDLVQAVEDEVEALAEAAGGGQGARVSASSAGSR